MNTLLLCKILAALEWQNQPSHYDTIYNYINIRYPEIFHEVQNVFNHLYLEL